MFHSHKKCCWQSWDTEGVWVLLVPYNIITSCALHCLAQALALPKSSRPSRRNPSRRMSHAKESLLRLHSKGQQLKETSNVAPVTQKEILIFKGVSGKLVKCNLAPPCNSWIKRTQNITTVTAISFQKAECSWLKAIILHCWPRLGWPQPQSGRDILRLALGSVLERRDCICKEWSTSCYHTDTYGKYTHVPLNLLSSKLNPWGLWRVFHQSSTWSRFTKRSSSLWSLTYSMTRSRTKTA